MFIKCPKKRTHTILEINKNHTKCIWMLWCIHGDNVLPLNSAKFKTADFALIWLYITSEKQGELHDTWHKKLIIGISQHPNRCIFINNELLNSFKSTNLKKTVKRHNYRLIRFLPFASFSYIMTEICIIITNVLYYYTPGAVKAIRAPVAWVGGRRTCVINSQWFKLLEFFFSYLIF